jgi:hypothetical protein
MGACPRARWRSCKFEQSIPGPHVTIMSSTTTLQQARKKDSIDGCCAAGYPLHTQLRLQRS